MSEDGTMAERLHVEKGEVIHITGKMNTRVESTVLRYDDSGMIALHVPGAAVAVIVQYENGEYYTRPGRRIVQLARPVFASARVKSLKTADGILDINGHTYRIGHTYKTDLLSMTEREYTHDDHPGRVWNRMSITVYDDQDVPRVMPVELLDIETPA
jgi:hypothetical protein